jgi:hypothetical protein
MAQTIYKLAEQAYSLIEGGDPGVASSISINELKISVGQVINQKLKIDYFNTGLKLGEVIPNSTVIAKYDNVLVTQNGTGKSKATLPVKPLGLPRNMGVWSIYIPDEPEKEFIPLQMGQSNLLRSQLMINDLLGQVGYETRGLNIYFTKDLTQTNRVMISGVAFSYINVELAILDISNYGDYDILPVPPEMEWEIIQEVYRLYITQPTADKIVSATAKEDKGTPLRQQEES